jgi:hypothetical protein
MRAASARGRRPTSAPGSTGTTTANQYDGWGRLVQVWELGTLTFDSDGEVDAGTPGARLVHFAYDGLGRLARKYAPLANQQVRTEHYYYDGARRIQETITDPLLTQWPPPWDENVMSMEEEEGTPLEPFQIWADRAFGRSNAQSWVVKYRLPPAHSKHAKEADDCKSACRWQRNDQELCLHSRSACHCQ